MRMRKFSFQHNHNFIMIRFAKAYEERMVTWDSREAEDIPGAEGMVDGMWFRCS